MWARRIWTWVFNEGMAKDLKIFMYVLAMVKMKMDREANELFGEFAVEGAVEEGKMDGLCTVEKLDNL